MKNPYKDALIAELNALAHAPNLMGLQHLAATWGATDEELAPSKGMCAGTKPKKPVGRPRDDLARGLAKQAIRILRADNKRTKGLRKNVHLQVTSDPALQSSVKWLLNNHMKDLEQEIDSENYAN